jgi:hypothetical protein
MKKILFWADVVALVITAMLAVDVNRFAGELVAVIYAVVCVLFIAVFNALLVKIWSLNK